MQGPTILSETVEKYRARTHHLGFSAAGRVALFIVLLVGMAVAIAGTILTALAPDEDQLTGLAIILSWAAGTVVATVLGSFVWLVDAATQEIRKATSGTARGAP